MKPQKQKRKAPHGDCERACIASLLELPITEVPDFTNMREDIDAAYPVAFLEKQAFLKAHGYCWVEIILRHTKWVSQPFTPYAIFKGTHTSGEQHAIIGKCEDNLMIPIYDPLEPEGININPFVDGKIDSIAFLVPIDPSMFQYHKPYDPALIQLDGRN